MRIGIITCHTPQNYGAMLQAYGLQKYLSDQSVYSEIINYAPKIFDEELSLLYVGNKNIKANFIKKILYLILKLPARIKRRYNFEDFKHNYLNISKKRYYSYAELVNNTPKYDQYICGSDQIWNTKGIRGWDPAFYLQFVPQISKRNSYAASMSLSAPITEQVKTIVFPMISEINRVSLRESSIIKEIQPYINKELNYVLDPVYLLSNIEWQKLALDAPKETKDYILIYPMGDFEHVLNNAIILSRHTGLPIYCITASARNSKYIKKSFDCSIPKFVRLFLDAQYVLTNSFHGTSFSIIFNKCFWACEIENNNHRITGILEELGLLGRYVKKNHQINIYEKAIDYSIAKNKLDIMIRNSKSYINSIISK